MSPAASCSGSSRAATARRLRDGGSLVRNWTPTTTNASPGCWPHSSSADFSSPTTEPSSSFTRRCSSGGHGSPAGSPRTLRAACYIGTWRRLHWSGTAPGATKASSTGAHASPGRSSGRMPDAPELNRLESEFLDESRRASERETARQQRANRRLRLLLVLALTLLALSIAAAVVTLQQGSQARRQARVADAQRLGAQALSDPSLHRSLLLAAAGITSTTRLRRAATCSPHSCAARPRSAWRTKAATACSTKRSAPTAARSSSAATTATSSSSTRRPCAESGRPLDPTMI